MNTSSGSWIIAAAAAAAAIFVLDLFIPLGIAMPMLYVLPILLTGLLPGRHSTILIAGSALLLTWLGAALSPGKLMPEALINRAMASALLLTIGWLLLINKESAQKIRAAQQARNESEERLRLAQTAEGFGTFDWDIPARKIIWSPETEQIWGLPIGGFEGTYEHWRRLVHPDDVAEAERKARLALDNPDLSYAHDHRIVRPDGTVRWIHAKATIVRDAVGRAIRMVGVNADITDRKRVEESLRKAQDLLQDTEKIGHVGGWEFNIDTRKQTWTDEVYRIHGVSRDFEPTVDNGITFYPPDSRQIIERVVQRAIEEGDPFDVELEFLTAQRNRRWVHAIGKRDVEGRRVYGFFQDITERKRVEEELHRMNETLEQRVAERTAALQETEARFRGIFEHAAEGIAIRDLEGRFVQCNAAYAAIVGYSQHELAAMQFPSLIHPDDRVRNMELIRQLLRGDLPSFEIENRYLTKSGRVTWVRKYGSILRNDQGVPTHLIVLVTDIAQRKQDEEELRRQQALLEDLTTKLFTAQDNERQRIARDLHDDFSQRLAALALDVGSLQRCPPLLPEVLGQALEPVQEELAQLSDDLRQLAHRLHPSLLQHAGLKAAIEDYIHKAIERTGLLIILKAKELPGSIPLDWSTCLFRVLQESLQNVVKHAKATEVVVKLSGSSKGIGLSVIDNGKGFDARDKSGHQKALGLISMQERLRLLNGFLNIHSRPTDGTKVCAWIPCRERKS